MIKFRAWDELHKIMYQSDIIQKINTESGAIWVGNRHEIYYKNDCALMQYTGLKDSKNIEIYDGDIIKGRINDSKYRVETMGKIIFDYHFSFYASKNLSGSTALFKINNIEVIGNIHENPKLLEEK